MTLLNILGIFAALILLNLGELLKNETKQEYVSKGYSWSIVSIYSNVFAIISGLTVSFILNYQIVSADLNPHFLPFAVTVIAYITTQSFMTDLRILMINRNILRVAYVSMYIISVYNVISSPTFKSNTFALIVFTGIIILIFLFSPIGASDVRAIAVALPYVISIGGYDAIIMFIITLVVLSIVIEIMNKYKDRKRLAKFKEDNKEVYKEMNKLLFYKLARDMIRNEKTEEQLATPVGPYMILPFLIFLFVYPFLI